MSIIKRIAATLFIASATFVVADTAISAEPDWPAVADEETVYVVTTDEDGDLRKTKIWMTVIDATPYIRTSRNSTWGANAERAPEVSIIVAENEYPLQAHLIEDVSERERIVAVFEEKYGSNPIMNWIRGDNPRIMRLDAR